MRTGAEFLAAIRDDGRQRLLRRRAGARRHHASGISAARPIRIARLFDVAADPANRELMTFPSPATGAPVLRCYQIPKTAADLAARRAMSARWAEETFGLMGRTPDHVAGFLAGYAAKPSVFAEAGQQYAENVARYHEYARDNHLYLSYAIVPPQIDRSKPAHQAIRSDALCRRRGRTRRRHRAERRAAAGHGLGLFRCGLYQLHPSAGAGR